MVRLERQEASLIRVNAGDEGPLACGSPSELDAPRGYGGSSGFGSTISDDRVASGLRYAMGGIETKAAPIGPFRPPPRLRTKPPGLPPTANVVERPPGAAMAADTCTKCGGLLRENSQEVSPAAVAPVPTAVPQALEEGRAESVDSQGRITVLQYDPSRPLFPIPYSQAMQMGYTGDYSSGHDSYYDLRSYPSPDPGPPPVSPPYPSPHVPRSYPSPYPSLNSGAPSSQLSVR
jgi:hypothetical protein